MIRIPSHRNDLGAQAAEFAVAFCVLILCVLIPMVNLVAIPIRYVLARSIIDEYGASLSRTEKASDAFAQVASDTQLGNQLKAIGGVELKSEQIELTISRMDLNKSGSSTDSGIPQVTVDRPGRIPKQWLPDQAKGTCTYALRLIVNTEIAPMLTSKDKSWGWQIKGLTAPVPVTFIKQSQWENLGRDPVTSEYFINE